jgi:hypothetical protein
MNEFQVSIYCPFCQGYTSLTSEPVGDSLAMWKSERGMTWWIGVCNHCQDAILIFDDGLVVFPTLESTPADDRILFEEVILFGMENALIEA